LREEPDFFEADLRLDEDLPDEDLLAEEDFLPVRLLLPALLLRPLPLRADDLLACLPPAFFALLRADDFLAVDFFSEDFFAEDFFAAPCLRPLPDFLPP
jgi:hypothetical protein